MSEHTIYIKGNDINDFLMFKIRENIEYGKQYLILKLRFALANKKPYLSSI